MPHPAPPAPYSLADGHLELRAFDPSRNINRRYIVELSEDLFGHYVLETAWGRVDGWSAAKRVSFAARSDAERVVQYHLRRRATAERRIGVAYVPVEHA